MFRNHALAFRKAQSWPPHKDMNYRRQQPLCNMLTCPSSALFLGKLRICLVVWSHLAYVSSQAWRWSRHTWSINRQVNWVKCQHGIIQREEPGLELYCSHAGKQKCVCKYLFKQRLEIFLVCFLRQLLQFISIFPTKFYQMFMAEKESFDTTWQRMKVSDKKKSEQSWMLPQCFLVSGVQFSSAMPSPSSVKWSGLWKQEPKSFQVGDTLRTTFQSEKLHSV